MRVTLALYSLCFVFGCTAKAPKTAEPTASKSAPEAHAALAKHAEAQFAKEVLTVVDGVHVAIGYGLANSILLEGPEGVVVVDTLGTIDSAAEAKAALRKKSTKPLRAVILTHNHADHVFGTQAFLEGTEGVPVYAHETTGALIDRVVSDLRPAIYTRSMRMFGHPLPKDRHVSCGIGRELDHDPARLGLVRPTHTVKDRLQIEPAGIRLELVHAPGETDDQIFVWWPDKKVLLPGDNFYQAFPNLYTIRGTSYRDVKQWVASLDMMRALEPEILVPSHTRPIVGKAEVQRVLTDYRDAIQYVHDQTVRAMNKGLDPDQIAARVRLPAHLADVPHLAEHYGTVEWSARSIFTGYLGWFDGDPTTLHPLAARAKAERWQALLPKGASLKGAAQDALSKGDVQWAAELLRLHLAAAPDDTEAKRLQAKAFTHLGERHVSANGRNYYLTRAAELNGELVVRQPDLSEVSPASLKHLPAWRFLASMPVYLDADKAIDVEVTAAIAFSDEDQTYGVQVRKGVAIFSKGAPAAPDFTLVTTSETWKGLALQQINPAKAVLTGDLQLEGDLAALVGFLGLFDKP